MLLLRQLLTITTGDVTLKYSKKKGINEKTKESRKESRKASEKEGTPRLGTDYNSGKAAEQFDATPLPLAWLRDLIHNGEKYEVEFKDGKEWKGKDYNKDGNIIQTWLNGKNRNKKSFPLPFVTNFSLNQLV